MRESIITDEAAITFSGTTVAQLSAALDVNPRCAVARAGTSDETQAHTAADEDAKDCHTHHSSSHSHSHGGKCRDHHHAPAEWYEMWFFWVFLVIFILLPVSILCFLPPWHDYDAQKI